MALDARQHHLRLSAAATHTPAGLRDELGGVVNGFEHTQVLQTVWA